MLTYASTLAGACGSDVGDIASDHVVRLLHREVLELLTSLTLNLLAALPVQKYKS